MGWIVRCPFYTADSRLTVSCEGGVLRRFPDQDRKTEYVKAICCDGWESCPYAAALSAVYEIQDSEQRNNMLHSLYYDEMRQCLRECIQQMGQMDSIARHNAEVYRQDRERYTSDHMLDQHNIKVLTAVVGRLVSADHAEDRAEDHTTITMSVPDLLTWKDGHAVQCVADGDRLQITVLPSGAGASGPASGPGASSSAAGSERAGQTETDGQPAAEHGRQ